MHGMYSEVLQSQKKEGGTMKIKSKYFDEIQINPEKILTFPKGIPAFENLREFVLIDLPENNAFTCLQSIDQEQIAFLMITPWDFFPDYDIKIPDQELEEIGIDKKHQVKIYNIATIPEDPKDTTVNLLAPIIINADNRQAKQMVLNTSNYHTKHPLLSEQVEVDSC